MSERIPNLLENKTTIIFDFDGTLVDSNSIKYEAFEKCFEEYEEYFDAIMNYCRKHHHTPRHMKFKFAFKEIMGVTYTKEIENKMLKTFDLETTKKIIKTPEISGAVKFLNTVSGSYHMILLSSTPHDKLLYILETRGLDKYFDTIQGSPVNKAAWIKKYLNNSQIDPRKTLFFGDTLEDAEASKKAGCPFIAVGIKIPNYKNIQNFLDIC